MAIFEKTSNHQVLVDDTESLVCVLENTQNIDNHTEYYIKVQRGPSKDNKWYISRRYRDFAALNNVLQQSNINLPFPPKKLIGNMQPSFVAERRIALQNYMNEVLKNHILSMTLQVRCFLDPKNYTSNLAEQALQTVSIALRGEGRFELKGPLPGIGWRLRKHYFLVTDSESKTECLLSYQNYGPDKALCDKDLQSALKSLRTLRHTYVDPIIAAHNLESGAYVVRKIYDGGSLRDLLYDTNYSKNYLVKYGNPKVRKPFTVGQIAYYGYQILQALKYLHEKGLPHGNIHPGNIVIDNDKALLLDAENYFLGVHNLYRPYIVQLKKLPMYTLEEIDVYCFGRTVYEMAFAVPLDTCYVDKFPTEVPENLASVLDTCLSVDSYRHGLPPADKLCEYQLFQRLGDYSINGLKEIKPSFKMPSALKLQLSIIRGRYLDRLAYDHTMMENANREVRIRAILDSDEELRKHKRKAKKRNSLWKSTSSISETVRSNSVSTASSPTPPHMPPSTENGRESTIPSGCNSASTSAASVSPADGRGALLNAICNFDKKRLSRVVEPRNR